MGRQHCSWAPLIKFSKGRCSGTPRASRSERGPSSRPLEPLSGPMQRRNDPRGAAPISFARAVCRAISAPAAVVRASSGWPASDWCYHRPPARRAGSTRGILLIEGLPKGPTGMNLGRSGGARLAPHHYPSSNVSRPALPVCAHPIRPTLSFGHDCATGEQPSVAGGATKREPAGRMNTPASGYVGRFVKGSACAKRGPVSLAMRPSAIKNSLRILNSLRS